MGVLGHQGGNTGSQIGTLCQSGGGMVGTVLMCVNVKMVCSGQGATNAGDPFPN